ncbi:3-mercaptopyruvate sulfurtransferase [bacterium]|nr:3-mercaptopyruvate sulfurtransferase [bacterium]
MHEFGPLVSAQWLRARMGGAGVAVLDASWYMPAQLRDPDAEFLLERIPGAQRFDFDKVVVAAGSPLPHMLPAPGEFERHARRLGIAGSTPIVIYDTAGLFSAPRAWWMFRAMGRRDVAVLDGGLPGWKALGFDLEQGPAAAVAPGDFVAEAQGDRVAGSEDVLRAIEAGEPQIVDARPAGRFAGREKEPRPYLRCGHMPGALNLPFSDLVEDGRLVPAGRIRSAFAAAGFDPRRPGIASCGSGVTACVLALAAEVAGFQPFAVYDGSWAEWGKAGEDRFAVVSDARPATGA